jgi:glycosyltransferase involved in cell wall biosynthesis
MGASLMSRRAFRTKALGVVVPVHDEGKLLGDALDALGAAFGDIRDTDSLLVLVFDSCRDESVDVARKWTSELSGRHDLAVNCIVTDAQNVGVARRLGCAAVLRHWPGHSPERVWIATTDADSRVPRAWLSEQVRQHERGSDVWVGRVAVESNDARPDTLGRWQREYDREVHPIHGASLGFNGAKYLAVGGFSPLETGEDRDLLSALVSSGARVYFDSSLRVLTSARHRGRAPHGFADAFHRFDLALDAIAD